MRTLKNKQTKWRHEAWRGSLNEDTPDIYSTDHMEGGEGEKELPRNVLRWHLAGCMEDL